MKKNITDISPGALYHASGLQILNWHHQEKIEKGNSAFQEPEVLSLNIKFRELNFAAFEKAYRELIKRHDSLRTTFCTVNGNVMQCIATYQPHFYDTVAFDISSVAVKDNFIKEQTRYAIASVSNLRKGPLIKSLLFKVNAKEFWFIGIIHHIISDARSLDVIRKELTELYRHFKYGRLCSLSAFAGNIAELTEKQNNFVSGINGENEKTFWITKFRKYGKVDFKTLYDAYQTTLPACHSNDNEVAKVSIDRFINEKPLRGANTFRFLLSPQLSRAVNETAKSVKVTPFIFITSCFCFLFDYLNGQKNYLMATSINDRRTLKSRNMIGHLMYKIYLDLQSDTDETIISFMTKVYIAFLRASRHPIYQEKQYEEMDVPKFTTLYMNYSDLRNMEITHDHAFIDKHEKANRSCYVLSSVINNYNNCIELKWLYDLDVFTPEIIEFLTKQYCFIIKEVIADRNLTVQQLTSRCKTLNNVTTNAAHENCTIILDKAV